MCRHSGFRWGGAGRRECSCGSGGHSGGAVWERGSVLLVCFVYSPFSVSLLLLFPLFAVLLNCPYPDPPVSASFFPFSSAPRRGEGWPRSAFVTGCNQTRTVTLTPRFPQQSPFAHRIDQYFSSNVLHHPILHPNKKYTAQLQQKNEHFITKMAGFINHPPPKLTLFFLCDQTTGELLKLFIIALPMLQETECHKKKSS